MVSLSIWTTMERLVRFKLKISEARLEHLRAKRARQLTRLIAKHQDKPLKVARYQVRLVHVTR